MALRLPWPFRNSTPLDTKSLADDDACLAALLDGAVTSSGVPVVTPRNGMRCPPVRCSVQAIAEAIGQLPVHVHARKDDGSKERAPDHPVHTLLHDEANDWTPASDFREQLTRDALLFGNGYAFVNRIQGRPIELIRLAPESVSVVADPVSGEPLYQNGSAPLPRENVLHIRAPGCDGIKGDSPVLLAREPIRVAFILERFNADLFANGGRPSGVISVEAAANSEAVGRIRAAWELAHGAGKSGNTAILPGKTTYQQLTLTSVDAQFLELRKFAIEEISRVFRVPPVFLMEYGRATWGNAEEMGRQFVTYCLMPWIKRWEGEIRLKLFAPEERAKFKAEFLVDDLQRADFAARMEGYSKAIAARILNPNEARAAENRPAYDGGEKFENPNVSASPRPTEDE